MTSPAKIRANQRNARKSTGPTSSAGKQVSSQNALRHGLAATKYLDPELAARVQRLTAALKQSGVGHDRDPQAVHDLAEAMVDVRRVFEARRDAYDEVTCDSLDTAVIFTGEHLDLSLSARTLDQSGENAAIDDDRTQALSRFAEELEALHRYERSFLARRRSALRRLEAAAIHESAFDGL